MKNKFYINFIWLSAILIFFSFLLFFSSTCDYYYLIFSGREENIILGIISSAILLLLSEFVMFIRDRIRFGFLTGNYKRLKIYQVNEGRKQWPKTEDISKNGQIFRYTVDSIYHQLMVYDNQINSLKINLKYLTTGTYIGKADYNEGSTNITISLDTVNETQGKGTYQYYERRDNKLPDIGLFDIQVECSQNHTLLYLYYKNTIPTGAAEGYEIWEKI